MDKHEQQVPETGTGWERERRVHFDEIVLNYEKARWDYPDELFDDVFDYTGSGTSKKALEIGAGTGKATAPFLDAGFNVTVVEMSVNMSEFLSDKFKEHKTFNVITSTFEEANVEDDAYDLIYAASSFHWVDPDIGCPKIYRLLKPGGAVALFRSSKVTALNEELYEEMQESYKKYYHQPYQRPEDKGDLWSTREIIRGYGFENLTDYGFTDISMKLYEKILSYTADGYIALMDTMSDHRSLPDDNREALYNGLKEAILKHGGQIEKNYIFQLYMGKKPE